MKTKKSRKKESVFVTKGKRNKSIQSVMGKIGYLEQTKKQRVTH